MEMNGNNKDEDVKMEECKETLVYMWGYLPVRLPGGDSWKDVCGGGCGFALAISDSGKLITCGSADDEGQSYLTSGRHGEIPEQFPLPTEASVVNAAAGWAHCISVTETGEVYTWGWKECVPSAKVTRELGIGGSLQKDSGRKQSALPAEQDLGQVWGWGYGGDGQLGLGSRIKMVSTPHLIPCIELASFGKDRSISVRQGSMNSSAKIVGSYVKRIACGGRHSALLTDTGALLTFGWGLYGQCGHGNTSDQLRPTCVSSLTGIQVERIAAGLWHTVCISLEGRVYAFGGNQFGQLGTGADQADTVPKLLDAPSLESKRAKVVSCGARHSAVLTEDGQVLSWGWNKYGQLGLGGSMDRNIPSLVPIDGCLPRNMACGWLHTLSN